MTHPIGPCAALVVEVAGDGLVEASPAGPAEPVFVAREFEPVITAWKNRHRSVSGHQGAYDMREIVNAILYQGRTGCQWAHLPHDLPQKSATYHHFAAWRDDGTDRVIHEFLRCQVHERARR